MRGKDVLLDSLRQHGVEFVFGNPGTTESGLLDALLDAPELRYIMALHESVALGAAHYYSQAAQKPSFVNLHVAPGLGNALGMLYNAFEAGSPVVVTAGQQDTRTLLREPLLSADLVAMARPLTKWSAQAERADDLALLLHRAFKIAQDPPTGPVFLALPIDVLDQQTSQGALSPGRLYRGPSPDPRGIDVAAEMLLAADEPQIVIGDGASGLKAQSLLVALAEQLGAPVWYEGLHHHIGFPLAHRSCRSRLPADAEGQRRALAGADVILLIGGSFFEEVWYSEGPPFPDGAKILHIEDAAERLAKNFAVDIGIVSAAEPALAALSQALTNAADERFTAAAAARNRRLEEQKDEEIERQKQRAERRWHQHPISVPRLMSELKQAVPDDTIVVNEAITAVPDLYRTFGFARYGECYSTRGGGIGQALPGALGVKLVHPDHPILAISGDGSAMYSIQALWTAAHHGLGILYVILRNREYKILKYNIDVYRRRFGVATDRPYPQMDLYAPELDFAEQARGMGVWAQSVSSASDLEEAIREGLQHIQSDRPYLLDVEVERLGDNTT